MVIGTAALALGLGVALPAQAETAQEVFICHLNEGKTMADLDKAIADFNAMAGSLKGGEQYQAWVLTPTAAADMASVVWVGEMPDAVGLAAIGEDYRSSEAGKKQDEKFQKVMTCESRSTWISKKVR
jgi:hypothetical protein